MLALRAKNTLNKKFHQQVGIARLGGPRKEKLTGIQLLEAQGVRTRSLVIINSIRAVWLEQQFVRSQETGEKSRLVTHQLGKSNGRLLETGE
jgi:hypothetical protein